jgi:hypothetical protein
MAKKRVTWQGICCKNGFIYIERKRHKPDILIHNWDIIHMKIRVVNHFCRGKYLRSHTLWEVVIAMAIAAVMMAGTIIGYLQSSRRVEWSSYSLAAQSLAIQRLEQTRASQVIPGLNIDQLQPTNFPTITNNILDIPLMGTNYEYATTYTTITTVSANPMIKMIRVDCAWSFKGKNSYTNSVVVYRAADQ